MALTEQERVRCFARMMRKYLTTGSLTKPQLRAFIDATDDWVEANQVSYNNAIPTPARTTLTATEKAAGLMLVIAKRFGVEV